MKLHRVSAAIEAFPSRFSAGCLLADRMTGMT